ncbi:hypothetical protein CI105_07450 [Candidatus Izimaplasma bacterium ZiA1]|uniref:TetR/AcrR family transcriptional regulator n=1 Tax=Candidatus Izimoplasma sp. ZiA1 TaxID=2024899 RepID=UPI000BAA421F|nr:hypothetical protein CI105_07450 [Candidatus Izimaplasma bacterium ZiA1]
MRKLENQKQIILETSKELVLNSSYKDLSIRKIAKECNISIGTIYNYYHDKNEIFIDILKDFWITFFNDLKSIKQSETFIKTLDIFNSHLESISIKFRYELLSRYLETDLLNKGNELHNEHQAYFSKLIDDLLSKFYIIDGDKRKELAYFITKNLVFIIKDNTYSYDCFKDQLLIVLNTYKKEIYNGNI